MKKNAAIFFFKGLAWIELMVNRDIDYKTGLPRQPPIAWKNVSQTERLKILALVDNFKKTNTSCQ